MIYKKFLPLLLMLLFLLAPINSFTQEKPEVGISEQLGKTPSPPPHENFLEPPVVDHDPYTYIGGKPA